MKLSRKNWNSYVTRLSAINKTAGKKMQAWIDKYGTDNVQALVEYAYALTTSYGEAASAAACQMYDEVAAIQNAHVPPAEPKPTQHINYVDKAIRSTLDRAPSTVPSTVSEMVKRTGAETTLKNAQRDGAYFAWVPDGDTCAFCITLASNGWRRASKKTINGDHAEHIHKNCNCEFAISFNGPGQIEGYDPEALRAQYDAAEGDNWQDKVNAMRRAHYAANKDAINAQKRAAYARLVAKNEYEGIPNSWEMKGDDIKDNALSGANPNYDPYMPKDLKGKKEDYTTNCTNAVVAYEMRKRGYDVTACSTGENKRLKRKAFTAWKGRIPAKTTDSGLEDILRYMDGADDGTRIEITVNFPDDPFFGRIPGHAFVAEKKNGETVFLDPQRNQTIKENFFDRVKKDGTMFMRIDDLEISDRGVSACKIVK